MDRRPTDVELGLITAEQAALSADQGLDYIPPAWQERGYELMDENPVGSPWWLRGAELAAGEL
jgi:hypothetical protein